MNNEHFNHDTGINFRIRITDIGDISASYEDTELRFIVTIPVSTLSESRLYFLEYKNFGVRFECPSQEKWDLLCANIINAMESPRIDSTSMVDIIKLNSPKYKGLLIMLLENPHYQKMVASPFLLLDSDINQDFFNNMDVS